LIFTFIFSLSPCLLISFHFSTPKDREAKNG